jgi:hypothetical protein
MLFLADGLLGEEYLFVVAVIVVVHALTQLSLNRLVAMRTDDGKALGLADAVDGLPAVRADYASAVHRENPASQALNSFGRVSQPGKARGVEINPLSV